MALADFLPFIPLGSALITVGSAIYIAHKAKRLEGDLKRVSVRLDQSILSIHRAREAATQMHQAYVYIIYYPALLAPPSDTTVLKQAEYLAAWAELRGLAFSIGDHDLLELINQKLTTCWPSTGHPPISMRTPVLYVRPSDSIAVGV